MPTFLKGRSLAMKVIFSLVLSFLLVCPALAFGDGKSADILIEEAESALLRRDYPLAIKLVKESAVLVKSQTKTAFRYELAMRLAYLQGANESFYLMVEAWRSNNWDNTSENFNNFLDFFKEYVDLFGLAGTSGNPLEPKVLIYERKAAEKLLESIEEVLRNEWPTAAFLSAIADCELGSALFEFIGGKMDSRLKPSASVIPIS
jgi:hypothetical protein